MISLLLFIWSISGYEPSTHYSTRRAAPLLCVGATFQHTCLLFRFEGGTSTAHTKLYEALYNQIRSNGTLIATKMQQQVDFSELTPFWSHSLRRHDYHNYGWLSLFSLSYLNVNILLPYSYSVVIPRLPTTHWLDSFRIIFSAPVTAYINYVAIYKFVLHDMKNLSPESLSNQEKRYKEQSQHRQEV